MGTINFLLFLISVPALFYSGGLLVRSLTVLGRYFKLSEYVLSFILVAFATSLPELFIGINSAFQNATLLSLGNLIGANVLNISLVLGIAIVFSRGIDAQKPIEREDYFLILGVISLPIILIVDGVLSRIDGIILLGTFFVYVIYLVQTSHQRIKVNNITKTEQKAVSLIREFIIFGLGVVLLLVSSSFVVSYGIGLAEYFLLPLFLVGILVSIGTTLPEVVFSFKSVALKHNSMSLGNVFGSVIVNITLIMGLVAFIQPIFVENISRTVFGLSLTAILVALIQIIGYIRGKLEYRVGVSLVIIALFFVVIESLMK